MCNKNICFTSDVNWSAMLLITLKAGAGLKHLALQILQESLHLRLDMVWSILLYKSFEKVFIWGWIWFESFCFTNPLRKASLEAEAGLKHLALQILWERLHLRLDLVWSFFLYKSLKKSFIWGWSWFEAFFFTNP